MLSLHCGTIYELVKELFRVSRSRKPAISFLETRSGQVPMFQRVLPALPSKNTTVPNNRRLVNTILKFFSNIFALTFSAETTLGCGSEYIRPRTAGRKSFLEKIFTFFTPRPPPARRRCFQNPLPSPFYARNLFSKKSLQNKGFRTDSPDIWIAFQL